MDTTPDYRTMPQAVAIPLQALVDGARQMHELWRNSGTRGPVRTDGGALTCTRWWVPAPEDFRRLCDGKLRDQVAPLEAVISADTAEGAHVQRVLARIRQGLGRDLPAAYESTGSWALYGREPRPESRERMREARDALGHQFELFERGTAYLAGYIDRVGFGG